jgi:hypothetical protein
MEGPKIRDRKFRQTKSPLDFLKWTFQGFFMTPKGVHLRCYFKFSPLVFYPFVQTWLVTLMCMVCSLMLQRCTGRHQEIFIRYSAHGPCDGLDTLRKIALSYALTV